MNTFPDVSFSVDESMEITRKVVHNTIRQIVDSLDQVLNPAQMKHVRMILQQRRLDRLETRSLQTDLP